MLAGLSSILFGQFRLSFPCFSRLTEYYTVPGRGITETTGGILISLIDSFLYTLPNERRKKEREGKEGRETDTVWLISISAKSAGGEISLTANLAYQFSGCHYDSHHQIPRNHPDHQIPRNQTRHSLGNIGSKVTIRLLRNQDSLSDY